jgi:serine phosphatase RsbU (regulator of sigma subunit)
MAPGREKPLASAMGSCHDFLHLADGQLGVVIGDVTDKGVPAALVMASTRSVLRAAARDCPSPGETLRRANDLLYPDMPPSMFVTCFYATLDVRTGRLRYANAGHDLPYLRRDGAARELYATGSPLGLMPDRSYDEGEMALAPGDSLLLYTDGLVEAHNIQREMFGFPHLAALLGDLPAGAPMIAPLLAELHAFTGPAWEQEDDVTLVTLQWRRDEARGPHQGY